MINFTQSFNVAWERMHVVLFRPFDLGKWFAIGFSAFLAGLLEGGNGTSFNLNLPSNQNSSASISENNVDMHEVMRKVSEGLASHLGFIIMIAVFVVVLVVGIAVLVYWLGSRGEFMFLDNIVRNRGLVSWPWSYYSRQANSLFGLMMLFLGASLAVFGPLLIAIFYVGWQMLKDMSVTPMEISEMVFLGLMYVVFAVGYGTMFFVFREFGIPIMFRQGILARPAFVQALDLAAANPGSVTVFILLRFAIFIGVVIISLLLCCFTCCIYMLPYIGTVMMLPVLIYVRSFTLECLAQFGPEYNVWIVDSAASATVNPQQPRG